MRGRTQSCQARTFAGEPARARKNPALDLAPRRVAVNPRVRGRTTVTQRAVDYRVNLRVRGKPILAAWAATMYAGEPARARKNPVMFDEYR